MSKIEGRTSEGFFQGEPTRTFEGTFQIEADGPVFPVYLAIHPNQSRRIIINAPGVLGDIDGYSEKYKKLATHIQSEGLGAVVRTGGWNYMEEPSPDVPIRAALQYTRGHAWEICGDPKPEVMLMGFSSGASAIAGTAHEFPEVKRVLLYAPSGDMGQEAVRQGLRDFHGEVYIVIGDQDEVVGPQAGQLFNDLATGAAHKELFTIPNCGHQFRGEVNGRIMSEAPFYAFTVGQKPQFPDPAGGIRLYG